MVRGVALLLMAAVGMTAWAEMPAAERYPYGGERFTNYVAESCRATHASNPAAFYAWMDHAMARLPAGKTSGRWPVALQRQRSDLEATSSPVQRARKEMALAARLHHAIKTSIPNFSLERGFEFTNVMRRGERQCFLQS